MEIQKLTINDIDMCGDNTVEGVEHSLCGFVDTCFTEEYVPCTDCAFNRDIGEEFYNEIKNSTKERVIEEIQIIAMLS